MGAVRTLAEKVIEQAQRYVTLKMDRKIQRRYRSASNQSLAV
jgi:hypothetical protein